MKERESARKSNESSLQQIGALNKDIETIAKQNKELSNQLETSGKQFASLSGEHLIAQKANRELSERIPIWRSVHQRTLKVAAQYR